MFVPTFGRRNKQKENEMDLWRVGMGLIVCGLIMTIGGLGAVTLSVVGEVTKYQNSGKVILETVQEYSQFKRLVGNESVEIGDITVLSSEPPIVVDFTIIRSADFEFPYGESVPYSGRLDWLMWFVGIGGILFAFGGIGLCIHEVEKSV